MHSTNIFSVPVKYRFYGFTIKQDRFSSLWNIVWQLQQEKKM